MSEGVTDAQRAALIALSPTLDTGTYLAGGVAIAIALHHRTSIDLDLFVTHDFDPDRLAERLASAIPSLRVVGRAPGTLHAEVSGVPISVCRIAIRCCRPRARCRTFPFLWRRSRTSPA